MPDQPHFFPVLPAHAIERSAITVAFEQPVPSKIFAKLIEATSNQLMPSAWRLENQQTFGFHIDAKTGRVTPTEGTGPKNFISADQTGSITLFENILVWQTSNYVRWKAFFSQFRTFVAPILQIYLDAVSASAVKVECWDRFFWSEPSWDNLKLELLLNRDGVLYAKRIFENKREWHSHAGWFTQANSSRRLVQTNIDAVELLPPRSSVPHPSIGIYTMMQDEINVPGYMAERRELTEADIAEIANDLHKEIKILFGKIITANMAERVGLNGKESA